MNDIIDFPNKKDKLGNYSGESIISGGCIGISTDISASMTFRKIHIQFRRLKMLIILKKFESEKDYHQNTSSK